jgi:hypothetical protein
MADNENWDEKLEAAWKRFDHEREGAYNDRSHKMAFVAGWAVRNEEIANILSDVCSMHAGRTTEECPAFQIRDRLQEGVNERRSYLRRLSSLSGAARRKR